jgi:hypothetical protein
MMGGQARGHRLTVGVTTSFIDPWCDNRGGKRCALIDTLKGCSKHEFTRHLNSSHDAPFTSWDTTTISKIGPMIAVGLLQLRVLRQNLPNWARAAQSKQSEG